MIRIDLYIRNGKAVGDFYLNEEDFQFGFNLDELDKVKAKIQDLMVSELEKHEKDSVETLIRKSQADKSVIRITDEISENHQVITVYRIIDNQIISKEYSFWI